MERSHLRRVFSGAIFQILLIFLMLAAVTPARASVDAGKAWLSAQIAANGTLLSQNTSVALPTQTQSEVATTLKAIGLNPPPALLSQIQKTPLQTTEYLSRYARAAKMQGASPTNYLTPLAALQNSDGGFGAAAAYASNPIDTAWALLAMQPEQIRSAAAQNAVEWLLRNQQTDGSWKMSTDEEAVTPTALVVQALQEYRANAGVNTAQNTARRWLSSQKKADQSWGRADTTAQALLALLPGETNASAYAGSIAQLERTQLANGSWQADAYVTALALRALWLAEQPTTNPDLASIRGVVLDDKTSMPISGAAVTLQNQQITVHTDTNGNFLLSGLPAGADVLSITASGYRTLHTNLELQVGQNTDLGLVRLTVNSNAGDTTVTIFGIAKFRDVSEDRVTVNTLITAGGKSTTTNDKGEFRLEGVPAGEIVLTAKWMWSTFPDIKVNLTGKPGDLILFNPLFIQRQASTGGLTLVVTDKETGVPVGGVVLTLNSYAGSITDANGVAKFTSWVRVGLNTLYVESPGYESVFMTFNVPPAEDVTLPIQLESAKTNETIVKGVVTDLSTHLPLSGVKISLSKGGEAQTDGNGEYVLMVPPQSAGGNDILYEKSGYFSYTILLPISHSRTHNIDVPLQPKVNAAHPASLGIRVYDRTTGSPLEGAIVKLSGNNIVSTRTDAAGSAMISGLQVGKTEIIVAASGYEGVAASVNVMPGAQYQLPMELQPKTNASMRLFGTVIDAVSQKPLADAEVNLSGGSSLAVLTDSSGYYEFSSITPGVWAVSARKAGYQPILRTLELSGSAEANIPLLVSTGDPSKLNWAAFGTIIDSDSFDVLPGARVLLQEIQLGTAVFREELLSSDARGEFSVSGLTHENARLFVTLSGYDPQVISLTRAGGDLQSIGNIMLKRSYVAALPDLLLGQIDRGGLVLDPYSFMASGEVTAEVVNNGNFDAAAFDVVLFEDVNLDGVWQRNSDRLLGRERISSLSRQQGKTVRFTVKNASLAFRDAPLYVMVDASYEVVEGIDGNNVKRVAVNCANGGDFQDVAVCIDASGSVSNALYQIEVEGVISALQNPNMIPHDGSVRFTVDTAASDYQGLLHPGVVVTPENLPRLLTEMRSKPPRGGESSGATCTRYLSEYLLTLSPKSSKKTLITIGDGYWEPSGTAKAMLPGTIANGVSRIDAVGVGQVNMPTLEENVWPQPANSRNGGRVTVVNSSTGVAEAISQAISSAVRTFDLTLGNFRLMDQGAGRPVKLMMRVGNAGSASLATSVEVWQGVNLLGTLDVPPLRSGEWVDLELVTNQVNGNDALRAVVDPTGLNAECNVANNSQSINFSPSNALAEISVSTDKSAYAANAPVSLSGLVVNLGKFDAQLSVALQIIDSGGVEVVRFSSADIGSIASGVSAVHRQPWSTGVFSTGTYTLKGQVLDIQGNVLDEDATLFSIVSSTGTAPMGGIGVLTDRHQYTPDDRVRIDSLARNLTLNATIENARIELNVADSKGTVVFTDSFTLGQLTPGSLRTRDVAQTLSNMALGEYVVTAMLYGSGNTLQPDTHLATASARYSVVAAIQPILPPAPHPGANADYVVKNTAKKSPLTVGEAATWEIEVTNNGPEDGYGVLIETLLPVNLKNISWTCRATGQAACGAATGSGNVLMDALIYSGAANRIIIRITGQTQAAGTLTHRATVSALGGSIDSDPSNNQSDADVLVTGQAGPVPIPLMGHPLALGALSVLMLAAMGRTHRQRRTRNRGEPRRAGLANNTPDTRAASRRGQGRDAS